MRKLKLQMQISLDDFVTMEYGGTNFNWDNEVRSFSIENLTNVDNILLGRNTAEDFIPYWAEVASNPTDSDYKFWKTIDRYSQNYFFKQTQDQQVG